MNRPLRIGSTLAVAVICFAAAGWLWRSNSAPHTGPSPLQATTDSGTQPAAAGTAPASAGPESRRTASAGPAAGPALEMEKAASLLFHPGETLDYTANVANLTNVASLRLVVAGRQSFFGRPAWHLQAFAHTQNALRMVFVLDDQFDSYSDASSLASFQYEMHLNERGDTINRNFRMTTGEQPAPPDATAARVLPGTRDPLGMIQYLRTVDWKKTPRVSGPVFDGQKLYDVRARLENPAVSVTVPAGTFTATRIEVRLFQNGTEVKDTTFALNLANNDARTPVLLEAVIPFATARVELLRAQ